MSTFTWPFLVMASRPVPSGFPVVGSNTMPACAGTEPPSVVGTITGLPQAVAETEPSAQM